MAQPTETAGRGSPPTGKGPVLALLATAPRPGLSLRGCCPPLTPAEAGALQTAWLKSAAQELPGATVLLYGQPLDALPMLKYFAGPGVELRPHRFQPGVGGQEPIQALAAELFAEGFGPVLVRLCDVPDVIDADLQACLAATLHGRLVLAPDQRGQAWLTGFADAGQLTAFALADAHQLPLQRGPWRRTIRHGDDLTHLLHERLGTDAGPAELGVRNLQASLQFYDVVLGAELLAREPGRARLGFGDERRAGGPLVLVERGAGFVPNGLCRHVADLVAWRDRLGAHQVVRPGDELGAAVDGIRDFTLTDPCGNRLTFREAT